MDLLRFALLGLGPGAVYALSALGLVLVHRGSGVLNFAHGAFGAVGAMWFFLLRDDWGWPTPVALPVALALVGAMGAAMHLVVMRRLARATATTRVIATLGVLSAVQGCVLHLRGTDLRLVDGVLPSEPVEVLGITLGRDRLLLAALATVLALVLAAGTRWTRLGVATQAVAENPRAAAAIGWSPDLIAAGTWAVGAALGALAAVLIASVVGLSMIELSMLVIPALAAALVGRFESFLATLAAALAIGIAESEVTRYVTVPGASKAVPLVLILGVLALGGRTLPERGEAVGQAAAVGTGRVGAGAGAAVVVVVSAVLLLDGGWVAALTTSAIAGIVGLSVLVVTGYAGQLSLAQFAIAGLAALVAGRLVGAAGAPFEIGVVAGVATAVPVGLVVGLPALRTRGLALAVATLGLALAIERTILLNPDLTGGFAGTVVGDLRILGVDLSSIRHPERFALLAVGLATTSGLLVANLRRSRAGRRLLAIRTNERAAAALGIDVRLAKLAAFSTGAVVAAVAGMLTAFRYPQVVFTEFGLFDSITAVTNTVLGGVGFLGGALGGGALATDGAAAHALPGSAGWLPVGAGVLVVVLLLVAPEGLAGLVARRRPAGPPPTAAVPRRRSPRVPSPLVVEGLRVAFGGVLALDGVDLEVRPGSVVGLLGTNGAGKTTLLDAVSGFVRPAAGSIRLGTEHLTALAPHERARLGVARSFQAPELFGGMTVREQLLAAADDWDGAAYLTGLVRPGGAGLDGDAAWAVEHLGLADVLDHDVGRLPYGRRRLVALARAIASSPAVLLLDEPAAGLDQDEAQELGHLVAALAAERGIGVLVVEHDVALVAAICESVVVVDAGRVLAAGAPEAVLRSPEVVEAYLGSTPVPAGAGA